MMNPEDQSLFQPPISNFGASNVEVCRICLATDVKMYSLQDTDLGRCIDSIVGFKESYEGVPKYVCYQCAPCMMKCNKLLEKSRMAQATLLEIFAKNGQITKHLIEEHAKSQPNVLYPLDSYLLLNYFYIKYDDDNNTSNFIKTKSDPNEKINIKIKNEKVESTDDDDEELFQGFKTDTIDVKNEIENEMISDDDVEEIRMHIPVVEVDSDEERNEDFISLVPYKVDKGSRGSNSQCKKPIYNKPKHRLPKDQRPKARGQKKKKKSTIDLSPYFHEQQYMGKYFDIREIPSRTAVRKYSCKSCPRNFSNIDEANDHIYLGCGRAKASKNNLRAASSISGPATNISDRSKIQNWKDWDALS